MSREAIARVREAEARAADIRAQATAKAQQMRTDNEKACAEKHDVRVKEMSAALRAGLDSMQEKLTEQEKKTSALRALFEYEQALRSGTDSKITSTSIKVEAQKVWLDAEMLDYYVSLKAGQ